MAKKRKPDEFSDVKITLSDFPMPGFRLHIKAFENVLPGKTTEGAMAIYNPQGEIIFKDWAKVDGVGEAMQTGLVHQKFHGEKAHISKRNIAMFCHSLLCQKQGDTKTKGDEKALKLFGLKDVRNIRKYRNNAQQDLGIFYKDLVEFVFVAEPHPTTGKLSDSLVFLITELTSPLEFLGSDGSYQVKFSACGWAWFSSKTTAHYNCFNLSFSTINTKEQLIKECFASLNNPTS